LEGFDVRVDTENLNTGFKLNDMIKQGAVEASKSARQKESVEEFHEKLVTNLQKIRGVRDTIFPDQLVLEIGVAILVENFRIPFKNLLYKCSSFLTNNVIAALDLTLGDFPNFKDEVQSILLKDMEHNKVKAEEYLDVQIDIHKRFINSEHEEFSKLNKQLRKKGIRYGNNFDLWFKENIPKPTANNDTTSDTGESEDDYEDSFIDSAIDVASVVDPEVGVFKKAVKKVRGFVERLQSSGNNEVHTNKLPSTKEDEAMLHMDLCLDYMEIVDKALVDEVPKIFVMMLVMKTIDFLNGVNERGSPHYSSLLREVQALIREPGVVERMVTRSEAHEVMVRDLKERKAACEDTIKVIDATNTQLNACS